MVVHLGILEIFKRQGFQAVYGRGNSGLAVAYAL